MKRAKRLLGGHVIVLGVLVVRVLAIGPKDLRVDTKPRAMDFKDDKNPQHTFLRRGSKAVGTMPKDFTVH
jgi:hypothetical protein